MNRNQIKRTLEKIIDKINDNLLELEDLKNECEISLDEIEPYENKNELTQQQEERQEWLQDIINSLDDFINELDLSTLEYYLD